MISILIVIIKLDVFLGLCHWHNYICLNFLYIIMKLSALVFDEM